MESHSIEINLTKWPQEYVQVAGSSEGFTVEVRKVESEGAHQYVVGQRERGSRTGVRNTLIEWNGCKSVVDENEV